MKPARILIVEDEAVISMLLESKLESMGYEVCGKTGRGDKAIELAAATKPDLVLMDVTLIGPINGISAAQAICENQKVPIVFLTAYCEPETILKIEAQLRCIFLTKPIKTENLKAALENFLIN